MTAREVVAYAKMCSLCFYLFFVKDEKGITLEEEVGREELTGILRHAQTNDEKSQLRKLLSNLQASEVGY